MLSKVFNLEIAVQEIQDNSLPGTIKHRTNYKANFSSDELASLITNQARERAWI